MTVIETDRIAMADESNERDERTLDAMFEALEKMPVPEGIKVEIVEGNIFMSPQRDTHWQITLDVIQQLSAKYPIERIKSDVRFDFPGHLNGFACDVVALSEDAAMDSKGHWHYSDVEFIAEVISRKTAANDYGPKKVAYAVAEVPVYVIANPYTGRCHVYTQPKGSEYTDEAMVTFGAEIDLTHTVVGLPLKTAEFPRD
ncbi:Uma2 family endonuclease [Streptomyces sp. NPDC056244]|uniref:Uma2 family endonuclease n=1 Tax=Streptomyces sp. NPDC056244 TaxID=3345762 RepID=UPI0035E371F6